jgi:hypothetical protein
MRTNLFPRLVVFVLTLALADVGLIKASSASADTSNWSDTVNGEDVLVQACNGFDITGSYMMNREFKFVQYSTGNHVLERTRVSYEGALANSMTGQSLPYDGAFTRIADDHRGIVIVTDFRLRIGLPTPGDFTLTFARMELNLTTDPISVLHTVAQRELESGICARLGRMSTAGQPVTVDTENSDLQLSKPCDVRPRPGLPSHCPSS